MSDTDLTFDLAAVLLFALAAIVFLLGWLQTGQQLFLLIGLLMGLATAYMVYRVRNLYIA
ncbi:MAG: hypothetical protein U5K70_08320 [Halodesulfurarchaeum sp.]|nr:hypothetical protein [Halodesulfurarchaeum sp.]